MLQRIHETRHHPVIFARSHHQRDNNYGNNTGTESDAPFRYATSVEDSIRNLATALC